MPRLRGDFWIPEDEWTFDSDDPDEDANPDRHHCSGCGRVAGPDDPCQGPGPFPRPCPSGRTMPADPGAWHTVRRECAAPGQPVVSRYGRLIDPDDPEDGDWVDESAAEDRGMSYMERDPDREAYADELWSSRGQRLAFQGLRVPGDPVTGDDVDRMREEDWNPPGGLNDW